MPFVTLIYRCKFYVGIACFLCRVKNIRLYVNLGIIILLSVGCLDVHGVFYGEISCFPH